MSAAQPDAIRFERFGPGDGLSSYVVRAFGEDALGFVWVGTLYGADRYDGRRFRPFSLSREGAASTRGVTAIVPDRTQDGAVWMAATDGLYRYDPSPQRFDRFTRAAHGLPSDTVTALHYDRHGHVWAGTARGLVRWHPESRRFATPRRSQRRSLPSDTVTVLLGSAVFPDVLWVGTARGMGAIETHPSAHDPSMLLGAVQAIVGDASITALAEVGTRLLIGTRTGMLVSVELPTAGGVPRVTRIAQAVLSGRGGVSSLTVSRAYPSTVWVGTRSGGLVRLDVESRAATAFVADDRDGSLTHNDVLVVHEDEAGSLWVGTMLGLHKARLPRLRFATPGVTTPASPSLAGMRRLILTAHVAASDPARVWLAPARVGLVRHDLETGDARMFAADALPDLLFSIHEDRLGQLWVGGRGGTLFHVDRSREEATAYELQPAPSSASGDLRHIVEHPTRPGRLLVATNGDGLVEFDTRTAQVVRRYSTGGPPAERLRSDKLWRLHASSAAPGVVWIGTEGGGLSRLDLEAGTVRTWTQGEMPECVPSQSITALASTSDGTLWLGTGDAGLARFDPDGRGCARYTPAEGLAHTDVAGIVVDRRDRLWVSSSNGLTRLDPASGLLTTFSEEDGLQGDIFHYHAHQLTGDGAVLFGGANGFDLFHPDSIAVDDTPPRVVLTRLYVDGEPVPLHTNSGGYAPVYLDPSQRDIAVEFAALDLRQPEKNRYAVWFEGVEPTWRELGTRAEIRYPVVPYGHHTLHVRGTNRDGVWSATAVQLPVVIRPPAWQAPWFWAYIAVGTLGVVVAAYQYRIYYLLRIERTRQRIADDLHDDIGSKVSNVALRLDLAGRSPGLPDAERAHLAELAQTARGVVDDLRDAVWIVDAGHDSLPALVARMEQFTEAMLRGRRYAFHCPDDLPPAALSMEARRHLYLLFKEAVHNAVRHGDPTCVEVTVCYVGGHFHLRIADDGSGFDAASVQRGRGLTTLHARAKALGGRLAIDSTVGRGTTVTLRLPVRRRPV